MMSIRNIMMNIRNIMIDIRNIVINIRNYARVDFDESYIFNSLYWLETQIF